MFIKLTFACVCLGVIQYTDDLLALSFILFGQMSNNDDSQRYRLETENVTNFVQIAE